MNRQHAAKNQRRKKKQANFRAIVQAIAMSIGFDGHFKNMYHSGSPMFFPTRSQRVKNKIRQRQFAS